MTPGVKVALAAGPSAPPPGSILWSSCKGTALPLLFPVDRATSPWFDLKHPSSSPQISTTGGRPRRGSSASQPQGCHKGGKELSSLADAHCIGHHQELLPKEGEVVAKAVGLREGGLRLTCNPKEALGERPGSISSPPHGRRAVRSGGRYGVLGRAGRLLKASFRILFGLFLFS